MSGPRRRPLARWLRRVPLALGLAALAGLPAGGSSRADPPPASFPGTPQEYEALELYKAHKLLTARTRADDILKVEPESVVANYVMGSVLRDAEGSLPRAMTHLKDANRLYELRYGRAGNTDSRFHADILWGIQSTASLMEQFELQIQMLDDYDSLYEPKAIAQHAWPLMKLGRYDEARDAARRALATKQSWQELTALNALCAVEAEAHQRQASYDACMQAFERARQHARDSHETDPDKMPHVAVHAYNASLAALTVLKFDDAERLALEGTHRQERTATNPWRLLAWMYLNEGRTGDAVAALREMQAWCAHQPPDQRDQKSAETDGVVADVLLAAGEAETGLRFISRALDRPDRRGLDSSSADQSLGAHAVIRRALLRLSAELSAERGSWEGPVGRAGGLLAALGQEAQAWPDEERAIGVLANDERLDMAVRAYQDGGLEFLPLWLTGDLVAIVGPGIVEAMVARARVEEAAQPGMAAYFDALDAEVAFARGETGAAVRSALAALEALPQAEALLRARVAAVAAEAASREGDFKSSLGLFERALQVDPGVVRRLGLSIPAAVVASGGGDADEAAALLRRSPRLHEAQGAFQVRVAAAGQGLRACLVTPLGAELGCGAAEPQATDRPGDLARRLAAEFHKGAFAMKIGLTPSDLRSLDGSTTMAQGSAREALRGILGDVPGGDPNPPPGP